jgi:inner membrane protein
MITSPTNYFEKFVTWLKSSVSIKLTMIAILILMLQIPLSMVNGLVSERRQRQSQVTHEISSLWGGSNVVSPFVLTIPHWKYDVVPQKVGDEIEDKIVKRRGYIHFLPKTLNVNGIIDSDIRYRSIYEVAVYTSNLNIDAGFEKPNFSQFGIQPNDILWDEAHLNLGIRELKGIEDPGHVIINGDSYYFDPGIPSKENFNSGIHSYFAINSETDSFDVSFELELKGSQNISFTPMGEKTTVHLISSWKDPSFNGNFIPSSSTIDDNGFDATWKVSHLNRNYPQIFSGNNDQISYASFGVDLMLPVNNYARVHRATKYGILFISLNFLIFFFLQILKKVKMHGIQYLLVGVAICIFFVLLIALTEHIGFTSAYWISCTASSMMIGIYSLSILRNMNFALIVLSTLFSFFGYMFVAIQMQDFSLLFGSIGLFIILALVMYFSRKYNWNASDPEST